MKLDEALKQLDEGSLEQLTTRRFLSSLASGDFKNLQDAFFKADEGITNTVKFLKRALEEIPTVDRRSEAFLNIKSNLAAAKATQNAWKKITLGKVL